MAFGSRFIRRAVAGVAFAGIATLAACGKDSTGPSGDTYTLRTINGASLPITEGDEFGSFTIKSGNISLKANGTYTARITMSFKFGDEPAETFVSGENGTYVISGSTITMTSTHDFEDGELTPSDGAVVTGTKTATSITLSETDPDTGETITLVFRK